MANDGKFVVIPDSVRLFEPFARDLVEKVAKFRPRGMCEIYSVKPVVYGIEQVTIRWEERRACVSATTVDLGKLDPAFKGEQSLRWWWVDVYALVHPIPENYTPQPPTVHPQQYYQDTLGPDQLLRINGVPVARAIPEGSVYLIWDSQEEKALLSLKKPDGRDGTKKLVKRAKYTDLESYMEAQIKLQGLGETQAIIEKLRGIGLPEHVKSVLNQV
jgi:hypothetical protein